MNLQEVLDHLSNTELSQISIRQQEAGVINDVNREAVVSTINLALTAIHKRFNLREGRLIVHLNEGTTLYQLDRSKVGRNPEYRSTRYLEENKLFELNSTLLKVLRVYNDCGRELSLNDLADPFTLRTPRYDVLEVPGAMVKTLANLPEYLKTKSLDVRYRANHEKLGKWSNEFFMEAGCCSACDMEDIEVDIPESYLEPLIFWVASRFHNPVGMLNEFHAGNSYYAKYEAACARLEQEGMQVDQVSQVGFRRPGWA